MECGIAVNGRRGYRVTGIAIVWSNGTTRDCHKVVGLRVVVMVASMAAGCVERAIARRLASEGNSVLSTGISSFCDKLSKLVFRDVRNLLANHCEEPGMTIKCQRMRYLWKGSELSLCGCSRQSTRGTWAHNLR